MGFSRIYPAQPSFCFDGYSENLVTVLISREGYGYFYRQMKNIGGKSKYIAFLDECGDHSINEIDADFPIFVLSLVIMTRDAYKNVLIPSMTALKLRYWNHEGINLHSRHIRKAEGAFNFLLNSNMRSEFMASLNTLMEETPYQICLSWIDKNKHVAAFGKDAANPYDLALEFTLEQVFSFLETNQEAELPLIAESRGRREDSDLEKAFYKLMSCGSDHVKIELMKKLDCSLVFWDKRANIAGLQMADLVAYPCARHILKPDQPNRAFDILKGKIYRQNGVEEW